MRYGGILGEVRPAGRYETRSKPGATNVKEEFAGVSYECMKGLLLQERLEIDRLHSSLLWWPKNVW